MADSRIQCCDAIWAWYGMCELSDGADTHVSQLSTKDTTPVHPPIAPVTRLNDCGDSHDEADCRTHATELVLPATVAAATHNNQQASSRNGAVQRNGQGSPVLRDNNCTAPSSGLGRQETVNRLHTHHPTHPTHPHHHIGDNMVGCNLGEVLMYNTTAVHSGLRSGWRGVIKVGAHFWIWYRLKHPTNRGKQGNAQSSVQGARVTPDARPAGPHERDGTGTATTSGSFRVVLPDIRSPTNNML